MMKKRFAVALAITACIAGCSKPQQTGFRPAPSAAGGEPGKPVVTARRDASDERLARIEERLKKSGYALVLMTFASPISTSKDSRVLETADFWYCVRANPHVGALLTTAVADDGKFIELQIPLAGREDALAVAGALDPALAEAARKLLAGGGETALDGGYSVRLSNTCVTAADKRALVIRSRLGSHEFEADSYEITRGMILKMYLTQKGEDGEKGN